MEKKLSTVTMTTAAWQINEQRHEIRERRLCRIIVVLIIALFITGIVKFNGFGTPPEMITETVEATYGK
jgi:hypothetical protein